MNTTNPAHQARIKCTDTLRNVAYIYHAGGGWRCTLANGTPAAFSYAGVPDNQQMACKFALQDCQSPDAVLATLKRFGPSQYTYELQGVEAQPLHTRLAAVIREARDAGYAIAVFNPDEVEGVDVDDLEQRLVMEGNEFIADANGAGDD